MAPGAGFEIDADRFRSGRLERTGSRREPRRPQPDRFSEAGPILGSKEQQDRKSTRLNSSHGYISYAVFCLKKKKTIQSLRSTFQKPDAIFHTNDPAITAGRYYISYAEASNTRYEVPSLTTNTVRYTNGATH